MCWHPMVRDSEIGVAFSWFLIKYYMGGYQISKIDNLLEKQFYSNWQCQFIKC